MGTNSCCCGKYDARRGTKIIGITSIVLTALTILGCIWEMTRAVRDLPDQFVWTNETTEIEILEAAQRGFDKLNRDLSNELQHSPELRLGLFGMAIGIGLFSCLVAVLLIFSSKKNNRFLALPFMIWTIITQVACGILIPMVAIYCVIVDWSAPDSGEFIHIFVIPLVVFVISFIINIWWLLVVFNFYKLLKSGQAFDSIPMQTA